MDRFTTLWVPTLLLLLGCVLIALGIAATSHDATLGQIVLGAIVASAGLVQSLEGLRRH